MPQHRIDSPVGRLTLVEADGALTEISWRGAASGTLADDAETPLLRAAARQLDAYFQGALSQFDLALAPAGNAFQHRVWQAMSEIPYGATHSYGELAARAGGSARAVGTACGQNPLPIVVPCHRVIGGDGRLVGYSGGDGVATKHFLLQLEGALLI